jgi:ribosomal protein S18 acetylase RimI-like enzyme
MQLRADMTSIYRYDKSHERELIMLLSKEADWNSFTSEGSIDKFRAALLSSETFICKSNSEVCGYLRALVDEFGIYVSELYVAPSHRNNGFGKDLLSRIRDEHPGKDVYVLSDEDLYYEKLGCERCGSVFKLRPSVGKSTHATIA